MLSPSPFPLKPGVEETIVLCSDINGSSLGAGDRREGASLDRERAEKISAHQKVDAQAVYANTFSADFFAKSDHTRNTFPTMAHFRP